MLPLYKPKSPLKKQAARSQRQNLQENMFSLQNQNLNTQFQYYQNTQDNISINNNINNNNNKYINNQPNIQKRNSVIPVNNCFNQTRKNKQNYEFPVYSPSHRQMHRENIDMNLQCNEILHQNMESDSLVCNQTLSYLGNGSSNQNTQRRQACSPDSLLERMNQILQKYKQKDMQSQKRIKDMQNTTKKLFQQVQYYKSKFG